MLRFFSQRSGIQKTVLWGFIAILVLGLGIVFAIPSGRSMIRSYTPIGETTIAASVDGYAVTVSELRQRVSNYGRTQTPTGRPGEEPDAAMLYPQYGKQALDSLINDRLVRREADRLDIGVSDQELRDRIVAMFPGPNGKGWVGLDEYQTRLRGLGLKVEDFEAEVANGIVNEKLRSLLTAGLAVSDREIEDDYRRTNTTMTPTYVVVAPKPDAVPAPSDDELRAFFNAHQGDFKITQPQRKIAYLFVSQDNVGKTLAITDDELKQDYDPKKYVSSIHVAAIVLNVPSSDKDAEVRKKAQDVADRVRGGGDKQPEDFAAVAKETSEDKATAEKGGDAGVLDKASIKPGDPRERLFSMDKDQTSAPIKVGAQYIVYKILDLKQKSFEEAHDELLTQARTRKAYSRGVELAQQAEQKLRDEKDPQKVANEINQSVGATADAPVVTVRETGYTQPGDQLPDIGANPQFSDEVAKLEKVGDVGSTVGITGGFAVPMLADRREPHDASFDEVKDRVATAWRNDKAKQAARDTATQLAQATSPDDLKARAKAAGYDAKTQENFKAGGTLPEFTASDLIDNALLTLPANSVSKTPLDMSQGFVVLANGDRKEPDMGDTFNQQRDSIRDRLLATKQGQVFDAYMKGLRKQLEDAGDIAIYQDVIDRAFSTGSTDEDDTDTSVPGLPPVGAPKAPITGPGGRPLTPPPPSSFTPPGSPAGAPAGAPPRLPNSTKPAPAPATKPATPPAPAPKKP